MYVDVARSNRRMVKTAYSETSKLVLFAQYYYSNSNQEGRNRSACSPQEEDEKLYRVLGREAEGKDYLAELDVDSGIIILE
jgi:hypothetical protein